MAVMEPLLERPPVSEPLCTLFRDRLAPVLSDRKQNLLGVALLRAVIVAAGTDINGIIRDAALSDLAEFEKRADEPEWRGLADLAAHWAGIHLTWPYPGTPVSPIDANSNDIGHLMRHTFDYADHASRTRAIIFRVEYNPLAAPCLTAVQALLPGFLDMIAHGAVHEVQFDPSWRSEYIVGLARKMYESRDFTRMPDLADELEDSECAHPHILSHCRGGGPHMRGDWVVDVILGKD